MLEDTLGVSLFLRHGKRLSVTEDGRMYALRLRMALADLAEATDDVLALPREDELVLAVLPSFAAHWLVRRLPGLIRLSRRTHGVLWQNIVLALGIKAAFLGLALAGLATMWMAVFADMGASLIVVANGLRMLRGGRA